MSDGPQNFDDLPVLDVPVSALALGFSPRAAGFDEENVRILAGLDRPWPPLLVQQRTYRVIDGMHRLLAARLRGDDVITVRLCDCDDSDAFVLAVRANVAHGLPLSLDDRKAAALRILGSRPTWSDRRIAMTSGLSGKTVAAIRGRHAPAEANLVGHRVGSDGRTRPVDAASRRATVTRLLDKDPGSSLREIARQAGVSPETVRSVKAGAEASRRSPAPRAPRWTAPEADPKRCLRILLNDPSLRSNEAGRVLLRALNAQALLERDLESLISVVPEYDLPTFEQLALANSTAWRSLAELAYGRRQKKKRVRRAT
jgi:ParB-like chromosome segregation protein Spo0J